MQSVLKAVFLPLISVLLSFSILAGCSSTSTNTGPDGDLDADADMDGDEDLDTEDEEWTDGDAETEEEAPREPDLGPLLNADFNDPILLTFAAARRRSDYMVDEGYTFSRSEEGVLSFVTDSAGDLGFAFEVDDVLYYRETQYHSPSIIRHTSSDTMVFDFELTPVIKVQASFIVATSHVALLELTFINKTHEETELTLIPWLRKCERPYTDISSINNGVKASHHVEFEAEVQILAPQTLVKDLTGALIADGANITLIGKKDCDAYETDIATLSQADELSGDQAAVIAYRRSITLPASGRSKALILRGVVDSDKANTLKGEMKDAEDLSIDELLVEGQDRLSGIPKLDGLTDEDALLYRSSFVLLDQVMMQAEGNLDHDYYIFSREPTWWFGRLGQHIHESLAMILTAHFDPETAMESQRVFIDRIEEDGYLPYNIGPVVEQTMLRTASAPLFAYVSWEIYRITGDDAFLREAYDTAALAHGFWVTQRDKDADGLCEWGGYGLTESVRDLENVIWENVATAEQVEAIGLNSMLVMEEKSLAKMAKALNLSDEESQWNEASSTRSALINDLLWDEVTGFYYHVKQTDNSFTFTETDDLKRMEIAGFLPLWAGIAPPDRVTSLLQKLTDEELFYRPYGIPSLAATDPYYSPEASQCCRWNGAVWVQWQFLLMRALIDLGENDLAREITRRTVESVKTQLAISNQFRELYNPDEVTAPNHSMPNYIWSSMAALMMLETADLE